MRNSSIESLIVGSGIALVVLLIRALAQGAPAMTQLLALLAAGVVLFCIQLALTLRRARQGGSPPEDQEQPLERARPLRERRRNPFARELTHDWMGLEDHPAERDVTAPFALDDLDDELWGETPGAAARKAAAKKVDDLHKS
jgi:hypothetical protein